MAGEQLRVTEGTESGAALSVAEELLIGRQAPQGEGRLAGDPELSRRHARVSRGADGHLTIEDLGSVNGTFVNDERIDGPRTLRVGDVIRVGRTVLQVSEGAAEAPAEPQPAADEPRDVRPDAEVPSGRSGDARPDAAVPAGESGDARADVDAPAGGSLDARPDAEHVLLVTAGREPGRRITLGDELIIGREVRGDGRLDDDPEVSRRHARIARSASGELTVEDLGSANGTFVNGQRLHDRQVLRPGDSIRLGSTILELSDAGRAPAPSAEAAPAAPPARPIPPAAPARPIPAAAPARPIPPAAPARPIPPAAPAEPTPPAPPPRPSPAAAPPRRPDPRPVPAAVPDRLVADRDRLVPELSRGSVFAACRIDQVISHGDMGIVYRAEELALQRLVALKLILPEYSSDERFRERFRRESRIAAAIDHPNVIPIFDAGEADGVLYIMMRLVDGTDLRALIAAEDHLEPRRVASIVRQVGAALDAAHSRGMLHRDVKPSNVLLARRDHVYLSDFGLAKLESSAEGLTRAGTMVARAEYAPPEQIMNERVDARADIYALGCLLFEALTGEAPFATESRGPLAHLEAPRPSPSDWRPDLPREFDAVVHRAMAKDPSERYPSAGDLGQAALVAAGVQRRASAESAVATGRAAPLAEHRRRASVAAAPAAAQPAAQSGRTDLLRWAIALAGLAIVAVGMVAALIGISSL